MINVLDETKKEENIKLLKLRDELYQKARVLSRITIFIVLIPIIYTILDQVFKFKLLSDTGYLKNDEISVLISLVSTAIIFLISSKIAKHKLESNILRQAYDCRVFQIRGNKFLIKEETKKKLILENITAEDRKRYEAWYGRDFAGESIKNILLCQVDNLLYTIYLYNEIKEKTTKIVIGIVISAIVIVIIALKINMMNAVIFNGIIPCSPLISILFVTWMKLVDIADNYDEIFVLIKSDIENGKLDTNYIEDIQDKILINRLNDVLVPRRIREHYLKESNEYKVKLGEFKTWLFEYKQ